jgi:hypothetical protein
MDIFVSICTKKQDKFIQEEESEAREVRNNCPFDTSYTPYDNKVRP